MLRLLAASGLLAAAVAQSSGWDSGQINATMCSWEQPRVAVVKDTVYMDGGTLFWIPGMNDGSYGSPNSDNNPLGIIWTLNFSMPFSTADNVTGAMGTLYKVAPGSSANNVAPNYYDGALLANDDEFFMYGGLLPQTDAYSYPDGDLVTSYQAEQYGAYRAQFRPGFVNADLPSGTTRYVAYGGAASAPSENKAWYFSGLRSPSWGPIYNVNGNDSLTAVNVSSTLISVDMSTQQDETWTNTTLPSTVDGRANPELVWVPVGKEGILVAIGGVTYPEFSSVIALSDNETASKADSPAFITTIDVYDIAGKAWYKQPTTGGAGIGQRTRACSVVATAADASSFNIYYYGGFDGLDVSADFNDDVWVLSLPSFTWTKVYNSSSTTHGRAGHKCVKPYPDQMFVIGGYPPLAGSSLSCLEGGIVQLFNLSSATWMDAYTPTHWSDYSVPDAVVKAIGGSGKGGATATAPAVSGGWAATGLKSVFATAYATSKITNYYPYPLNTTSSSTTHSSAPEASSTGGGSHTPKFLAPLLGVIGGLILLVLLGLAAFLYRKRQQLKNKSYASGRHSSRADGTHAESEATYDTHSNAVFRWLRAQPSVKHVPTSSASWDGDASHGAPHSTGTPISPEMAEMNLARGSPGFYAPSHGNSPHGLPTPHSDTNNASELTASNVFASELHGETNFRAELPADFPGSNVSSTDSSGNTKLGSANGFYAKSVSAELESPLSHPNQNSVLNGSNNGSSRNLDLAAAPDGGVVPRADSPSLGITQPFTPPPPQPTPPSTTTPNSAAAHFRESNISDISDHDRAHLRNGSDGGQSVASGVSSSVGGGFSQFVSPMGPDFPASIGGIMGSSPPQPQPIPEASAGAEAAAEREAAAAAARTDEHISPGEASPTQSRRSIFRESEADLKE